MNTESKNDVTSVAVSRLVRLNGCQITKDGVTYHCRWKTGFKNHCTIMIHGWSQGTTWATSGNAEVALDPADFCVRQSNTPNPNAQSL